MIVKDLYVKYLKPESGVSFWPIIVTIFFMSLLFISITFFEPFQVDRKCNYIADKIVKEIEESGEINAEIENMISDLCTEMKLDATIEYEGNFIYSSRGTMLIQIRDTFYVTVKKPGELKIIEPVFLDKPISFSYVAKARLKGKGQVYWRPSEM